MINPNWSRWVTASFAKHFDDNKGTLYLYVDGSDRDTATLKDFAEFRIDGPRIKQVSRNKFKLEVTVNVLIQSTMESDIYKLQRDIGIMTAAFLPSVNAFKYGTGVDDDQSLLGCFQLIGGKGNILGFDVRINNFGIIDETLRKQQATIEGQYRSEITI